MHKRQAVRLRKYWSLSDYARGIEVLRYFGIVVTLNYNDHSPPHFHAQHGDDELIVRIKDLSIVRGKFGPRATGLIMEWATIHQEELLAAWEDAQNHRKPRKIAPLA